MATETARAATDEAPEQSGGMELLGVRITREQRIEMDIMRRRMGMTKAQFFDAAMELYFRYHHDKPWPKAPRRPW